MSRYFSLTHSNTLGLGGRKKALNLRLKSGPYTMFFVLVLLTCLLSLFFLAQVFQSSTAGYEVSKYQKQIEEVKEKNKALEIKAVELRSFDKIKKEAEKLNMVKTDKIVYIKAKEHVAMSNR